MFVITWVEVEGVMLYVVRSLSASKRLRSYLVEDVVTEVEEFFVSVTPISTVIWPP